MKKRTNDKFEVKLQQELNEYFDNAATLELSVDKQAELKNLVIENKSKRNTLTLWKRITAFASVMCLIALIIIPTVIILNKNNNPQDPPTKPPTYYGNAEAIKIQHTLTEAQELVNSNFSKYNFMFSDLTYVSSKGFYHPENNSLLAIQILFNESEIPYTSVEIHLIASNQFVFDDQILYTAQAEYSETLDYKMYKLIHQETFSEYERGYIIYQDHEIYINLARINEVLFNKFI